ncbi:Multidrug resistance protein MdtG [subsurface metagenome]
MVFPLIPLFLITVLSTGAYAVGIVEGAAETTASLLKVVSGYWSDKIKRRKPFVLFGYSLSAITKPLFAFATIWSFVLFVRVIERIGKGLRTAPRDAIVAESSDESVRGKAYGFHRAMDGIGSVSGAALAFLLLPILGYRNIFLFAFMPGIIAVFVILFIKEKKTPAREGTKEISIKLSFKELPVNLKLFIIVSSIFALGHFGYAFLLLRAVDIGLADRMAILLYVLFYISYTVCAIPSGILSDKIGRKPVLSAGYLIFGITSLGLVFTSNIYSILLLFVIYGIFYAMIDGAQRAFVVDLAPKHLKATALGTFHTAIGLVALPGGYIAGLLWDKISPETTFIYGEF